MRFQGVLDRKLLLLLAFFLAGVILTFHNTAYGPKDIQNVVPDLVEPHKHSVTDPKASLLEREVLGVERVFHRSIGKLDKRELTTEQWNKYVQKGQSLLALMCQDAEEVTKSLRKPKLGDNQDATPWGSKWKDYDDLHKFGWTKSEGAEVNQMVEFKNSLPISTAMKALGLSMGVVPDGPNEGIYWEHTGDSTVDGTIYPTTSAQYSEVYNPKQGVIMAWMDYGPAFKMEKKYKDQPKAQWPPLVPLRQWSDVVFLQWKDLFKTSNAKDDITDLRYVFRITISNEDSTALILKAVKNKGAEFGYWPGTEFEPQSDEFKAILGSPNGAGVAWFLIDHKAQLGMKTVSKITVFRHEGKADEDQPIMLLTLKNKLVDKATNT